MGLKVDWACVNGMSGESRRVVKRECLDLFPFDPPCLRLTLSPFATFLTQCATNVPVLSSQFCINKIEKKMRHLANYRSIVALLTLLSGLLSLACLWVGALAMEYNFEAFSDPVLTLHYSHHYELAKWFNLLDMFGYYLLLLPCVFYFHQQYKFHSPWMPLISFSGLSYVLVGAIGAAILAALWPEQMKQHLASGSENATVALSLFQTTTLLVTKGLWNILEVLFASVWWIGLGLILWKEHKAIGIVTVLAGLSSFLDASGNMLEVKWLSDIGLNVYLLLGIVWPLLIGLFLLRQSVAARPISAYPSTPSSVTNETYEQA